MYGKQREGERGGERSRSTIRVGGDGAAVGVHGDGVDVGVVKMVSGYRWCSRRWVLPVAGSSRSIGLAVRSG
jgi:hypothetical protein